MNQQRQTIVVAALGVIAGAAGAATILVAGLDGLSLVVLAVLIAVGASVSFPVPFGGSVPTCYALLMALTELRDPGEFVSLTAGGLAATLLLIGARRGLSFATQVTTRIFLASAVGALTAAALESSSWGTSSGVLGRTLIVGAVMLSADALVARMVHGPERGFHYVPAAPVYLTLLCGGALIAVAYDAEGPWMATVALFPLLITRFSFQRQVDAQTTFSQTVQALGIVPELAGLAPLGHSERTAVYVDRLATNLGFSPQDQDRAVLAARLHHLGAVSLDPSDPHDAAPVDAAQLGDQGAAVLREGGFPSDVSALVADAAAGSLDTPSPSLEAAVLRVAIAFDDLVGSDLSLTDRALAILASRPRDPHSRRAMAGLLALVAADPDIVSSAIEAGARFSEAAEGLDLEALVGAGGGGEVLPFSKRRP